MKNVFNFGFQPNASFLSVFGFCHEFLFWCIPNRESQSTYVMDQTGPPPSRDDFSVNKISGCLQCLHVVKADIDSRKLKNGGKMCKSTLAVLYDITVRWTHNHSDNLNDSGSCLAYFLKLLNLEITLKNCIPEDLYEVLLESPGPCALTHSELRCRPVHCFHLTNSPCGVLSDIQNCISLLILGLLQRINQKPCWGF